MEVAEELGITSDPGPEEPTWYDQKSGKVDEVAFCNSLLDAHPLKYVGDRFYDINGLMRSEDLLKRS